MTDSTPDSTRDAAPQTGPDSTDTRFERYFGVAYAAARPYLLMRVLLSMLALDTWMLMIGHAGRYGAGDFNVAHIHLLDLVAPMPTPALYIGVLLLSGLLALVVAMTGGVRAIGALLFLLYTYSWSMSMLDSFQHHYFMSLLLACLVFFPALSARQVHPPDRAADAAPTLVRGLGYPLLCATVAILYFYTTLAKCDANWVDGATIQRISKAGYAVDPLRKLALSMGIGEQRFWSLLATAVIPHELFISVGYGLAPLRDSTTRPWLRHLCTWAGIGALLLHVGAERMGLEIGWFSYYMMALSVCVLLPAAWVDRLGRVVTVPAAWLSDALSDDAGADNARPGTLAMFAGVAAILHFTGGMIDLPGARAASWVAAGALLVHVVISLAADRPLASRPLLVATGAAAAVMWLAITTSDVRWDYYRFRGGDLMRRGELEEALWTYEKGERYAVIRSCESDHACSSFGGTCVAEHCVDPDGKPIRDSRQKKIDQLKRQLGR